MPNEREMQALTSLLTNQRKSAADEEAPPMVIVARVLLNLDETITKE